MSCRTTIRRLLSFAAVVALLLTAGLAPAGDASWESQRAKKLFETAMDLVDRGKHGLACPMLEESLSLEQGMGTKYYLARCYEQIGRLATAHRLLVEVKEEATKAGRRDRARHANKAAKELAPKVPKLTVMVPAELADSGVLVVTKDGEPLPRAQWGKAVPIDLGEHEIVARQQGSRLAWNQKVWMAKEGETTAIRVPVLDSLRASDEGKPAAAGTDLSQPAPPVSPDRQADDGSVDGLLIGGVVSLVGAAAFIGIFNWAWLEVDSIENDAGFERYLAHFTENEDVCARADEGSEFPDDLGAMSAADVVDSCSRASTMEIVQGVSLVGSIALSGLGIWLISASDTVAGDDEPSEPEVAVHVGDRFSGLVVRGRF